MGPARGESHWKRASGGCKNAPEKVAIDLGSQPEALAFPSLAGHLETGAVF